MLPYERERTLDEADAAISAFLREKGWRAEVTSTPGALSTARCLLADGSGRPLSSGYGKGSPRASAVGAVYEAVEHYFGMAAVATAGARLVSADALSADRRYADLPFAQAFALNAGRRIASRVYEGFSGRGAAEVPLFMTSPDYISAALMPGDDFDYRHALRYSSNSGVAIGASFAEAAVHAIGELVERDCWSLFLLAHFVGDPARCGAVVDPASLPAEVGACLDEAERQLRRNVVLIDITTDLGYPAFLATVTEPADGEVIRPHGCGASLHAPYAALRAISELVQYVDVKLGDPGSRELDRVVVGALGGYKKLQACARFEVDPGRIAVRRWAAPATPCPAPGPLLEQMLARLEKKGIGLYFRVNALEEGVFCVLSCVSFELERFFLVSAGLTVAPGRRGRAVLG